MKRTLLHVLYTVCIVYIIGCNECTVNCANTDNFPGPFANSTSPVILSTDPTGDRAGIGNISVATAVSVTFDQKMNADTVTAYHPDSGTTCANTSLRLFQDGSSDETDCILMREKPAAGNDGKTFTVTPKNPLEHDTNYKIAVKNRVAALDSMHMVADYASAYGFRTESISQKGPKVTSTDPTGDRAGIGNISVATAVSVTFDQKMNADTVTAYHPDSGTTCANTSLRLFQDGSSDETDCILMREKPAAGNDGKTFTVTPKNPLEHDTNYKIAVKNRVAALDSMHMVADYASAYGFRTELSPQAAPVVESLEPANSFEATVALLPTIKVTFNRAIKKDTLTVNTANTTCDSNKYSLQVSKDANFSGNSCIRMKSQPVASNGDRIFTVVPYGKLSPLKIHYVKVAKKVRSAENLPMGTDFNGRFGTRFQPVAWKPHKRNGYTILNKYTSYAYHPQLTVFNGKLFAAWSEQGQQNGHDRSIAVVEVLHGDNWYYLEPNSRTDMSLPTSNAFYTRLTVFDNSLYASWCVTNRRRITVERLDKLTNVYRSEWSNQDDHALQIPAGGDCAASRLTVFNDKLHAIWRWRYQKNTRDPHNYYLQMAEFQATQNGTRKLGDWFWTGRANYYYNYYQPHQLTIVSDDFAVQTAVFQGKLYAAMTRFAYPQPDQILVAEWQEENETWRRIPDIVFRVEWDKSAADPQLIPFDDSLWLIWSEATLTRIEGKIRVKRWDGEMPDWKVSEFPASDGIQYSNSGARYPRAIVFNDALFAIWTEGNIKRYGTVKGGKLKAKYLFSAGPNGWQSVATDGMTIRMDEPTLALLGDRLFIAGIDMDKSDGDLDYWIKMYEAVLE